MDNRFLSSLCSIAAASLSVIASVVGHTVEAAVFLAAALIITGLHQ